MERDPDTTESESVERTRPSSSTREAEREDAQVPAGADRPPTAEEEAAAPTELTDEQRAHEREMLERGASQQGEGRIP